LSKTVDVGHVLDEGRWTGYQKLLIFGTALTIILDGVDNQLLPNAVPTMAGEWGLTPRAFANALAAGPFGMMIGGIFGGLLGDKIGRRTALLGSALSFGADHARDRVRQRRPDIAGAAVPLRRRPRWCDAERGGACLGILCHAAAAHSQ
jgi:hypothetical protein